jgi:hypothetical protein
VTEHHGAAECGYHQPHDHRDGGGLAGAIAAEEPDGRAFARRQADVLHRVVRVVFLADIVQHDDGFTGWQDVA